MSSHLAITDQFREWARQAVEEWDGCSTEELILFIIQRTGEDYAEVLQGAAYKVRKGLWPLEPTKEPT
jgi:hypothetical protein